MQHENPLFDSCLVQSQQSLLCEKEKTNVNKHLESTCLSARDVWLSTHRQ